jgi:tetratricopeptide (TPR) repeat protein
MKFTPIRYTIAAMLVAMLFGRVMTAQDERNIRPLEPGKPIEREIAAGETHSYSLRLKAGEFIHVFVYQRGVNVAATLVAPDGKKLLESDSPLSTQEAEWITHVASAAGECKIEVRKVDKGAPPGRYEITIEEQRKSVPGDEARLSAQRLFAEANSLYDEQKADSSRKAIGKYEQALVLYRQAGRRREEAVTLNCAARAYTLNSDHIAAIEHYNRALSIYREMSDVHGEGITLSGIGYVHHVMGHYQEAINYYEKALPIQRELKDRAGERSTLNGLGNGYKGLNQYERAIGYYEQALAIAREVKNRPGEAIELFNLGSAYNSLNRYENAIDYYEQALAIERDVKNRAGEGRVLNNLGNAYDSLSRSGKAIEYYEQALAIAREVRNRASEGIALNGIGNIYKNLSRYEKAIEHYEQSLAIQLELKSRAGERSVLINLGNAYVGLSRYEKAREYYEQALAIARELKDRADEGSALNGIGNVYQSMSRYEKATEYYEQALALAREVKNRVDEGIALNNLGSAYDKLNRYDKAKAYYEQSLAIAREVKDRASEGSSLNNLGALCNGLGQYEKAIEYYEQALAIAREVKDRAGEGRTLANLGYAYFRLNLYEKAIAYSERALAILLEVKDRRLEGTTLTNLGNSYAAQNSYQKAIGYYEEALAIAREVKDRVGEGTAINNLGHTYYRLSRDDKAIEYYEQALAIEREVKARADEGVTLTNLMRLLLKQNNNRLAVFYGKQAVNAYQEIRGNIKTLDRDARQSFLRDKEDTYRILANLLISEARLPEAEQVLALLKEEEYSKIVRREGPLSSGVGFNKTETEGVRISDQLALLARDRGAIQARLDNKTASDNDRRRLDEIDSQIAPTNREFRRVMAEITKRPPADTRGLEAAQQSQSLMPDLRSLGQGTVALYTVVTKETGWIMMVTADSRKAYSIETNGLEQTIAQLREALKDDRFDPVPLAQRLYKMIMEAPQKEGPTLAQDLRAYGAKTLMWSLDGVLRYVPVTVLHDGKDYLVNSYTNVVFTTASISRLNKPVSRPWRGLGLGVSKKYGNFPALPGVEHELQSIFSMETGSKGSGVLAGQIKLNEAFTKQSMIDGLREGFSVVHIASHFSFDTANEEKSFLLLGDGNGLTLEELQDYQNIFEKVELLTLSACDTAVGGANGKEVEGFGYLAQNLGAKAVMASLWPVADVGAEALMREFYYLQTKDPRLSKAEAFQRAQLALLRGEEKSLNGKEKEARIRGPQVGGESSKELVPYKKDPSAPFAHPHYWAPFILIGNWK